MTPNATITFVIIIDLFIFIVYYFITIAAVVYSGHAVIRIMR